MGVNGLLSAQGCFYSNPILKSRMEIYKHIGPLDREEGSLYMYMYTETVVGSANRLFSKM